MKKIFYFLCVFLLLSCQNKTDSQSLNITSDSANIRPLTNKSVQKIKNPKYAFVLIAYKKPELDHNIKLNLDSVEFKEITFFSDIIEVDDYNEDVKFKLMDDFEKTLKINDTGYQMEVSNLVGDPKKKQILLKYHTKLKGRDIMIFDTYHDASEVLSQMKKI